MKPLEEHRQYERFLVSPHIDCAVQIRLPEEIKAELSDISEGGMMLLLSRNEDIDAVHPPQDIEAEIVSDNTALQFAFSGRVVWKREFQEGRRAFASMGIQFAPGVTLPEAFLELITAETD